MCAYAQTVRPSSVPAPSRLALLPRRWRFAMRGAQGLASLVSAFWICFAGLDAASHGWSAFWPAASVVAPLAALGASVWMWPRAAAPVLLGAATLAAWRFDDAAPRALLALPLGASGLTLLACVWRTMIRPG